MKHRNFRIVLSAPFHRASWFICAALCGCVAQYAPNSVYADEVSQVPLVGCQTSMQGELLDPPKGQAKSVRVRGPVAAQLAFYKAENGPGILGPRGWHCFAVSGSNGQLLFVTPICIHNLLRSCRSKSRYGGVLAKVASVWARLHHGIDCVCDRNNTRF